MTDLEQTREHLEVLADALTLPSEALTNPCTNCDGLGRYTTWPHTTCPTCGGTGIEGGYR